MRLSVFTPNRADYLRTLAELGDSWEIASIVKPLGDWRFLSAPGFYSRLEAPGTILYGDVLTLSPLGRFGPILPPFAR